MIIRKGNKEYRVTERSECWALSCTIGGLSVEYKVPKEMAEAFKEKCAATGTAQAQVIKKAIEQFLAE